MSAHREPPSPAEPGAPEVTVVVPTQDRAALVDRALASVAAQTFAAWECVVVDDGSTDETPAVLARWTATDPRFSSVRTERSSAAAARNCGLALARGRFVAFLDSDDLLPADKLAWQCAALAADPEAVLVYGETLQFRGERPDPLARDARGLQRGRGTIYQADRPRPHGDAFEDLLACSAIYAPLVRTAELRAAGGFDETLPSAEDWDAWLALARRGRVLWEPRMGLYYRVHAGNKSSDLPRNLACARRVARKHLAALPWRRRRAVARRVRRSFARSYGPRLREAAVERTRAGDWAGARPLWRALARVAPRRLAERTVLAHALWALLPLRRLPPWDRIEAPRRIPPAAFPRRIPPAAFPRRTPPAAFPRRIPPAGATHLAERPR